MAAKPIKRIALDARRVPVAADADVVVIGGGPGGFAAALQAARMGRSVVMIEKFDMPGGVHTSGLQGHAGAGVGGIHTELMEKFAAAGHIYTATEQSHPGWAGNPLSHYERNKQPGSDFVRMSFNPDGAGALMAGLLEEAGVRCFYGASFADVVVKKRGVGASITAAIIETASGRMAVRGKVFVDGSGTAELVARAGAPFVRGGGPQPKTTEWDGVERPIPGGLLWIMDGIDFQALRRHQSDAKDPVLAKVIAEATAAGDIPPGLYRPRMNGTGVYGDLYIGHPTLDMSPMLKDGTYILWQNVPYEWGLHMDDDANDASKAKAALRGFIEAEARFLNKYVPGFENATIQHVGRYLGTRDGRHPRGEYVLTIEDARKGRQFRDAVTRPMTKMFFWDNNAKYTFEVPYRSFLPRKIDNLLLTGASMSFSYEIIFMVMRNFPWCTQTGEIAGYAAARAVEKGITPKELEWTEPYPGF